MRNRFLSYLLRLNADNEERENFRRDPGKAMTKAGLNLSEQYALMSLALVSMKPQDIATAVLRVLEDGNGGEHGGGATGHGPP